MRLPGLYPILDVAGSVPLEEALFVASHIIAGGATLIQLRAKGVTSRQFLALALELSQLARSQGVTFIVNDRVDIALLAEAHGVHLGTTDLPLTAARTILGKDRIIGASSHTLEQALAAQEAGADYLAFGPIFATATKAGAEPPKGLPALSEVRARVTLPLVAIGGITEANAPQVIEAGADAVAIVSDLLKSPDIESKTRRLVQIISTATRG